MVGDTEIGKIGSVSGFPTAMISDFSDILGTL